MPVFSKACSSSTITCYQRESKFALQKVWGSCGKVMIEKQRWSWRREESALILIEWHNGSISKEDGKVQTMSVVLLEEGALKEVWVGSVEGIASKSLENNSTKGLVKNEKWEKERTMT